LGIRAGRNARKIDDNNTINLQEKGDVMGLGRIFFGVGKNKDGSNDKRNPDAGAAKMFDKTGSWAMKLMVYYPVGVALWIVKIMIFNPWGNVGFGGLGGLSLLAQYFGWIEPSAEPTAREIALGGSFDWISFGFGLALLIVGIIRLVGREVVVRKYEN
jgi:hypothetical protein